MKPAPILMLSVCLMALFQTCYGFSCYECESISSNLNCGEEVVKTEYLKAPKSHLHAANNSGGEKAGSKKAGGKKAEGKKAESEEVVVPLTYVTCAKAIYRDKDGNKYTKRAGQLSVADLKVFFGYLDILHGFGMKMVHVEVCNFNGCNH